MRFLMSVLLLAAYFAVAEEPKASSNPDNCPLHAQHMKDRDKDARFTGVKERGAESAGMGFSQEATTHHFISTPTGGVIQVTVNDAKDAATKKQVEDHMQRIAKMFSAGDFSIPHFVHNEEVPGVAYMREHLSEIAYRAENLNNGARVVITAKTPAALAEVHRFLEYQIAEHRTGDAPGTRASNEHKH